MVVSEAETDGAAEEWRRVEEEGEGGGGGGDKRKTGTSL